MIRKKLRLVKNYVLSLIFVSGEKNYVFIVTNKIIESDQKRIFLLNMGNKTRVSVDQSAIKNCQMLTHSANRSIYQY